VIFGHSHQTEDTTIDGIRILNPGSISYPRDTNKSYMEISINEKLKVDIKYLAS
jgi:predicted phosphodiesterase